MVHRIVREIVRRNFMEIWVFTETILSDRSLQVEIQTVEQLQLQQPNGYHNMNLS